MNAILWRCGPLLVFWRGGRTGGLLAAAGDIRGLFPRRPDPPLVCHRGVDRRHELPPGTLAADGRFGLCLRPGGGLARLGQSAGVGGAGVDFAALPVSQKALRHGRISERRYSPATRDVFVLLVLPALVLGVLAPALYVGGLVFSEAGLGRVRRIALDFRRLHRRGGPGDGGLLRLRRPDGRVWASAVGMVVFLVGGIVLAAAAVHHAGGLAEVLQANGPPRFSSFSWRRPSGVALDRGAGLCPVVGVWQSPWARSWSSDALGPQRARTPNWASVWPYSSSSSWRC